MEHSWDTFEPLTNSTMPISWTDEYTPVNAKNMNQLRNLIITLYNTFETSDKSSGVIKEVESLTYDKQDKLIAGDGIQISGNTISSYSEWEPISNS